MLRCLLYFLLPIILTGFQCVAREVNEKGEKNSISQSAVDLMGSYPSSFQDSSLSISPIYPIEKNISQSEVITVGNDLELSLSDENLHELSNNFCQYKQGNVHCPHCLNENQVCGEDIQCEQDPCCCCYCCCEEKEELTGLAAVGLGGGGFVGFGGGGYAVAGYFGGSGGGGGGGGGGGDNDDDDDNGGGGGGDTPIPEPSTVLILGGMTSLSVYLRRKRQK